MKLNPKQLAASAALLGVLACAAALPASAAGPVTTPLALTLPKVSFPWDKVTAESIETGSYDAAPLAGTAQQLSPVTTPANAASKNGVTYVSDNPNVVSVDSEGVAQAVGLGTANITATCGGVSCTYTITPQPDASMIATEMDITLASSTIAVGETTSLSLAVLPTSAANYINVSLSSSNEKVATVNNFGKVTARRPRQGHHHRHGWQRELHGHRYGGCGQHQHRLQPVHLPEHQLCGAQAGLFQDHHRQGVAGLCQPEPDLQEPGQEHCHRQRFRCHHRRCHGCHLRGGLQRHRLHLGHGHRQPHRIHLRQQQRHQR